MWRHYHGIFFSNCVINISKKPLNLWSCAESSNSVFLHRRDVFRYRDLETLSPELELFLKSSNLEILLWKGFLLVIIVFEVKLRQYLHSTSTLNRKNMYFSGDKIFFFSGQNMNISWLTGTVTQKIVFNRDLKTKKLRTTALILSGKVIIHRRS